jgi:hypothetical protein
MKRLVPVLLVTACFAAFVAPRAWTTANAQQGAAAAQAQDAKPAPPPASAPAAPPQRQVTPAQKALNEASAIKDVDQKIAAIRKVIVDFPKTPQVDQANTLLLDALIKAGGTANVQAQAKLMVAGADDTSRARVNRDVASALLRGDVLLEDAEAYAVAAVGALPDQQTYIEARKKEAAERAANAPRRPAGAEAAAGAAPASTTAPSSATAASAGEPATTPSGSGMAAVSSTGGPAPGGDEMFITRYKSEKQSTLSTLGQVYAKRGKKAEAEKSLREAYLIDTKTPAAATAALKLAEYAKAAGRNADQFDYLAGVALAGRLTPEAYADFQAVYRTMHKGSLDGLEELLDARYWKDGPKSPEVKPYERAADRTERVVLAEIFTGAGCPPCVAADLAFESAMHRYGPKDLAVLMYHLHVPRPDPMTNPFTQARSKFYAVSGVPTFVIDGEAKSGGGGAENAAPLYKRSVEPVVDKRLSTKPEAAIQLSGSATAKAVKATVSVTPGDTKATRLRLHLVLVEEQIRYSGENGVRFHPMVVRSMASTSTEPPKVAPAAAVPKAADAKPMEKAAAPQAADAKPKEKAAVPLPVPVLGFALEPGKAQRIEYTFDLAKVAADGLANLEDLEKNSTRFPDYKFTQKRHQVDPKRLLLVAFVQDEDSKQILQAVRVGLGQ